MIDALGIRGIWRGRDGTVDTRAVETLRAALEAAHGMKRYLEAALVPTNFLQEFEAEPKVTVLSLSDMMVVAAIAPADAVVDDRLRWGLVDLVCQCVAYVMRDAAKREPPLTCRGAVNYGRVLIEGTFLLGPAVDEVADAMESAEGAFVWLMPHADALEPRLYSPDVWSTMAFRYRVPLKGGTSIETTTLSPYVDNIDPRERGAIRRGYEKAMQSSRVDVTVKRQNTMRFLDHLDEVQGVEPE